MQDLIRIPVAGRMDSRFCWSSHDSVSGVAMADRVLLIEDGKLVWI